MAKPPRTHKKINDALLRKLWPTRMTEQRIAILMKHPRSVLRRRALKLGLQTRRREIWDNKRQRSTKKP